MDEFADDTVNQIYKNTDHRSYDSWDTRQAAYMNYMGKLQRALLTVHFSKRLSDSAYEVIVIKVLELRVCLWRCV